MPVPSEDGPLCWTEDDGQLGPCGDNPPGDHHCCCKQCGPTKPCGFSKIPCTNLCNMIGCDGGRF